MDFDECIRVLVATWNVRSSHKPHMGRIFQAILPPPHVLNMQLILIRAECHRMLTQRALTRAAKAIWRNGSGIIYFSFHSA